MLKKQVSNFCKVGAGASFLYMGSSKSVSTLHFKAPYNPRNLLQVDDLENKIIGDNYYSLKSRADHLEDVKKNPDYDLLVIGGGATGPGWHLTGPAEGLGFLLLILMILHQAPVPSLASFFMGGFDTWGRYSK
jgi:hypothetical protein